MSKQLSEIDPEKKLTTTEVRQLRIEIANAHSAFLAETQATASALLQMIAKGKCTRRDFKSIDPALSDSMIEAALRMLDTYGFISSRQSLDQLRTIYRLKRTIE